MKDNNKSVLLDVITALYILLFIYAAVNKLIDYQKFQIQIGKSPILAGLGHWVAFVIPGVEILLSVCLIIKNLRLVAMYGSVVLMGLFTTYIFVILNFAESIPCSCGGVLENMTWTQHFWFNVTFIILGSIAVLLHPDKRVQNIVQ